MDLADACIFVFENLNASTLYDHYNISHINIGCGDDISISDLANKISGIVGFNGRIKFNISKPDGTPRKLLDISKLSSMGWEPKVSLDEGIKITYNFFINQYD